MTLNLVIKYLQITTLGLMLLLINNSLAHTSPSYKKNGIIRVAYFSQDVPAIDPLFPSFDPDSYSVISQIFDSLIHSDLDGNLKPALATQWKRITKTKWIFTLRKNVKFHNGEKFNSKAVKFTFDYILNPNNKAGNAWIWDSLLKVELVPNAPHKVIFHTKYPDGMFLNRFSMFGAICPPNYIQKKGLQYFNKRPIGTGPFVFKSWNKGKSIKLTANPNYWKKEIPKLKGVEFKIIPEKKWISSLKNNQVDFVPNLRGSQTRNLAKSSDKIRIVKRKILAGYWTLIKNDGVLNNLNVRKALNHAINKRDLVRFADFGNAKPLASLGKEGEFGASKSTQPYEFNIKKSKELLKKEGIHKKIKLKVLAADIASNIAKIIKVQLSKINVELDLTIVPRAEVIKRVVQYKIKTGKRSNYDMIIILVDNPIYDLSFHAGLFLSSPSPWSLLNSPEFDKLYIKSIQIVDQKKRERLLNKLDEYIHNNALMIFSTQKIITAGVRKTFDIKKFGLNGHLGYEILSNARKSSITAVGE